MKIILAVSRYPWPARRGDQMRTVQMLDFLAREHQVTVLVPAPPNGVQPPAEAARTAKIVTYRAGPRSTSMIGLLRALRHGLPLQSSFYYQSDMSAQLRRLAPEADLAILQLVRLAIHVDDLGTTPLVVDLIDSLSLNFSMRARVDRLWMRPLLRVEARLLSIWEHRLLEQGIAGLVVCERDRIALARRRRLAPEVAARVSVIPMSVRERWQGVDDPHPAAVEKPERPVLTITGNLGYFVNDDAVRWFVRRVWPELHERRPDVRLVVAGDRPSRSLRRLLRRNGAELVESPAELRTIIAGATISLAPLRAGSGQPIKVLEAWSVGVPVIASPWAAAGTAGRPWQDFLVVDTPGEWLQALITLLDDREQRDRLVANARSRLIEIYSRRRIGGELLKLVASVGATLSRIEASGEAEAGRPGRVQTSDDPVGMGEFQDAKLTSVAVGPMRTPSARERRRG
jgi:glycosyltransferase involved in cell wall biosynthesis